jgi:non-specific serine/threonine protein kinase
MDAPLLDAQAKAAYKQRLEELREELQEAEGNNDLDRAERARAELEMLAAQLRGALGLGGRDRAAVTDLERARSAVGKRIRGEVKRIRAVNPALGRHLAATITTGYFCSYRPDADLQVVWEL